MSRRTADAVEAARFTWRRAEREWESAPVGPARTAADLAERAAWAAYRSARLDFLAADRG